MTVLFTDSGTRANGALGANYTTTSGMDTLVISSNRFIPNNSSLDAFQFVNSVVFTQSRQYAKATTSGVFNTGGVGAGMAVGVKFNTGGTNTGIRLAWNMVGWELGRFNAGVFTSLASASLAIADGDVMLIDYDGSSGVWLVQKNAVTVASGSGTDGSPIASGASGVGYSSVGNGASGFINFEAGDFTTSVTIGTIVQPPRVRPSQPGVPSWFAWIQRFQPGYFPNVSTLTLNPTEGSVVITGQIPSITLMLASSTGSVVISGQIPTVAQAVVISPALASVVITGQTPTLTTTLVPSVGSVVIIGNTPSITKILFPTEGSVVISGNTPALSLSLGPATGSVVITGNTPSLSLSLVPTAGSVVITGQVPTVNNTGSTILTPAEGQVIITGNAPTITLTMVIPASGQVIINGNAPSINPAPPGVDDQRRTMFPARHVRKRLIRRGR